MSASFGVVIPARYASTRLPGKPLRELAGRPMIVRVLDNARKTGADFVCVATDDSRIADAVRGAGGEVVMTSNAHTCGTDRITEVVTTRGLSDNDIVVNVQGDEPFLPPELVGRVAARLAADSAADIATLAVRYTRDEDSTDPNGVKVVLSQSGRAMYFSRALIPHDRDAGAAEFETEEELATLRHVGLYAYRVATLKRLSAHGPVAIEQTESLEQLRALWLDMRIVVETVEVAPPPGIDTESDLRRAEATLTHQIQ